MKNGNEYIDDRELEALIAEVENSGMIAPPVYLKELIMKEVNRRPEEGGKIRKASKEELVRAAKRRFFADSLKIVAAGQPQQRCSV